MLGLSIIKFDTIIKEIKKSLPNISIEDKYLIQKAYNFASEVHKNDFRKSGEPYIQHPLYVVHNLINVLGITDIESICAALLHDTIEDHPDITLQRIKDEFGINIAMLVDGLTKVGRVQYRGEERQVETLRNMFVACAKDIRVIFIRLADRLHNMQTIDALRPDKKNRIAVETLEIYVAIADRFSLWGIKSVLEDLCFKTLYPQEYEQVIDKLDNIKQQTKHNIHSLTRTIKNLLHKNGFYTQVSGRMKNSYSIFKKMKIKGKTFEEIYDIFGIRIITKNTSDCYNILGVLHSKFYPIPNKFKDYIAVPKINGYKSLHTTLMIGGQPVEIQIRTQEMHNIAEFGIASHFIYSDYKQAKKINIDQMDWIKKWAVIQKNISNTDYLDYFKSEFLTDDKKVYVFTPKNDIKYLPIGSTILDFAYIIHTDLGHRFKNGLVNKKIVPMDYKLHNGDTIEIITTNEPNPNINWINVVKTSQAKNKIRQYFNSLDRDKNIEEGKKLLDKELKVLGYDILKDISESKKRDIASILSYKTFDDILVAIGSLKMKPSVVIYRLFPQDKLLSQNQIKSLSPKISDDKKRDVLIDGQKNILFEFAQCCNPQYPNEIIGHVVSSGVVKIHKSDCAEVVNINSAKMINVGWESAEIKAININLEIVVKNELGVLNSITHILYNHQINVSNINSKKNDNDSSIILNLDLEVYSINQYNDIMEEISNLKYVENIMRIK